MQSWDALPEVPAELPAKPKPAKPVKVRGMTCPDCTGVRLFVYKTTRPRAGCIRRYRSCAACGYRETGEERRGRVLPKVGQPKPVAAPKPKPERKPPKVKFPVVLAAHERIYLTELLARGTAGRAALRRARILLAADQSNGRPARTQKAIAAIAGVGACGLTAVLKALYVNLGDDRIHQALFVNPAKAGAAA